MNELNFTIAKSELFRHPQFGNLRVLTDEKGDPWFVGKVIAEMLGYTNTPKAISDHVLSNDRKVLNYKDKDFRGKYLKGIIERLKETDATDRENGIFSKSEEYKKMYKAAVTYEKALRCGEDIPELKGELMDAAAAYIDMNAGIPKSESEQAKFDAAMTIIKETMTKEGFETVVTSVNSRRKARRPDKRGHIALDSYNGKKAEYVGNICMDVCMIDVTGIDCKEGDSVEIFGDHLPVTVLSDILETIPYEVMTGISNRVKRIYFQD